MREHPGKTDPILATRMIYQVTLGLEEIHNENITHRDIQPENILCK